MSPADRLLRRPRAALIALAAVVAFAFQGSRGLYETTEGRYAESALEMLQRGEYLEPTLAGRPHWTKPPLAYWAIAAGVAVAGPNAWGARLSGAVVSCATVLVVAALGALLWGGPSGLVAGLVYLSSPFPAAAASVVSTDTLLALWEILAVFLYLRARGEAAPARARRLVRAMWIVWGLAFLTKGPPGLLPLLALAAYARLSPSRARLLEPVGLAAFALVGLSWYAWVAVRHPGLLSYLLGDEVVGRVASNAFKRNPQWYKPFAIYLPVLLLGQGAWLVAGAQLFSRLGLASPRAVWARIRAGDAGALLLLWLLLPLGVLWISSSRLPLYVLPLYAPIALAIARGIVLATGETAPRRALAVALPSALVIVLLKAGAAYVPAAGKDMLSLARAVAREAGVEPAVLVYGGERLYGLQFYLRGALRRVSASGEEPWADGRLDDAAAEMTACRAGTFAVVAPRRAGAAVEAALAGAGVPHRRVQVDERELFVAPCGPAPEPSLTGAAWRRR